MSRGDGLTEQDRRDYYVYVHVDENDNFFYIGKGTGHRAWSKDRDRIWHRYVNERLGGKWRAEIVKEGLTEEEALTIEALLIEEYGTQLVNWDNPCRGFDEEAIAKYHAMRDAARKLVAEAQALEAMDLKRALAMYWTALDAAREYEKLTPGAGTSGRVKRLSQVRVPQGLGSANRLPGAPGPHRRGNRSDQELLRAVSRQHAEGASAQGGQAPGEVRLPSSWVEGGAAVDQPPR